MHFISQLTFFKESASQREPPKRSNKPKQQENIFTAPKLSPPSESFNQPKEAYSPPKESYSPPKQTFSPTKKSYSPPQESYNPPTQKYSPPTQSYSPAKDRRVNEQASPLSEPSQFANMASKERTESASSKSPVCAACGKQIR